MRQIQLGCAGWSLPREQWPAFTAEGTHLQRYASRFCAVEINSSFYRPHRPATYAKWAASVPAAFRFAVKVPKQITHERRLVDCAGLLDDFLGECGELGEKLGCLLIQLPPSLRYDAATAEAFLATLRTRYSGLAVIEPRHASWLAAHDLLVAQQIGQVAADPSPLPHGDEPGGWPGIRYFRLHGSPRIYHSAYAAAQLQAMASQLHSERAQGRACWCIFDNTASGAATADALHLQTLLNGYVG
ncbi:DUF72 domain-containing protein [Pseudomonas borbori]